MSSTTSEPELLRPDPWLGQVLGRAAARACPPAGSAWDPVELRAAMERLAAGGRAFFDAKVSTEDVTSSCRLQAAGMKVVDVTVTNELTVPSLAPTDATGIEILDGGDSEAVEATVAVSSRAFRYSRFHLDPDLDGAIADRVHAEWAANAAAGRRGDRVYVGRHDGAVVAFLIALVAEQDGTRAAVIDLLAVDSAARGRGLARRLTAAFLRDFASDGDRVLVGTQAVNVPALRLYHSMGFAPCHSDYVLHAHVG